MASDSSAAEGQLLLHRTKSSEFPNPESRISSISGLVSSIPPSEYGLDSDSVAAPAPEQVDISHVQLSSMPESPASKRLSQATAKLPDVLRIGPPPSPLSGKLFSWHSTQSHEPHSPSGTSLNLGRSITGRLKSVRLVGRKFSQHSTTNEEGDEMVTGLVSAASRFGAGGMAYTTVEVDDVERGVDISSFAGPMSLQDQATVMQYQRLESEGQLTGGLGEGIKPEARINSRELYAQVTSPVEVTRRISRRDGGLARAPTLKDLGQREANRRGQIIEVVVEDGETTPVDLSSFGGESSSSLDFSPTKHALGRVVPLFERAKVVMYYPRANWKPMPMQWYYLTGLIAISITLAVVQEYLYQRSNVLGGLYQFLTPQEFSTWDYFSFKYLPTILAVIYGIMWQYTDFEVKRLEAYYQLSRDGGALAAESINVDYITLFNIFRPFRAFRYKHWAVAFCSIATILAVSLVPTLLSASVIILPDRAERVADPQGLKFVSIHPVWSRLLSGTLSVIATLGCMLLYILSRRDSGLVADVKGIAGIAAMATKSHVLMDFKDLDTVSPKAIHHKLKNHRYTLRNSSLAPDDAVPVTHADQARYDQDRLDNNPHPLMLRPIATVPFLIALAVYLTLLPTILFTSANIVTERAPWLLTVLAVAIKIVFQTLEQDVRMMEPFYILSCRHAHPSVLTLDYTGMPFLQMPVRALLNGHHLMACVGFGTVLSEMLTVCATSFAVVAGADFVGNAGSQVSAGVETRASFWSAFVLAVFIIVYLIAVAATTLARRRHAFLPRQPSTIGSVLAFVHQSVMLYDFVGAEGDNEGMVRRLAGMGKTYGLGWFTGRDGETHCGVDEEELRGGYKHAEGQDVRRGTVGRVGGWDVY